MPKPSALLTRAEAPVYAALRIVSGALFSVHGMQKILGWFSTGHPSPAFGSQVWFGGIIELSCGTLIAVGLFARCAAFVASGMMAVAYLQFHWKLTFADNRWLPAVNMGELAVLYSFVFLFVATRGAGIASVDAVRRRGKR